MEEKDPQQNLTPTTSNNSPAASKPADSSAPNNKDAKKSDDSKGGQKKDGKSDPSKADKAKKKSDDYVFPSQAAFAKRKRQKKVAWIFAGVGFVGVSVLSIIAFLGRVSGHFTIQLLNDEGDALTMAENYDFSSGNETTYLRADGLSNANAISSDDICLFEDNYSIKIDSMVGGNKNQNKIIQELTSDSSSEGSSLSSSSSSSSFSSTGTADLSSSGTYAQDRWFAFTFFVKNASEKSTVSYNVSMSISNNQSSSDTSAVNLLDIIRVRLFENVVTDNAITHNSVTYANPSATPIDTAVGGDYRECIGSMNTTKYTGSDGNSYSKRIPSAIYDVNNGYATNFVSTSMVFDEARILESGFVRRYTALMWLEGNDPDCKGNPPREASLTYSLNFDVNGITDASASSSSSSSSSSNGGASS